MKELFDISSKKISKLITNEYSTSFSLGIKLFDQSIRPDIYSIYGFVRYADEIVDSFEGYNQEFLLNKFIEDYEISLREKISLNPILHSFQDVVLRYQIHDLVDCFLDSMKMDLHKSNYTSQEDYEKYIYGSADVVGLMCLKVFVDGDEEQYEQLKPHALKLGSAFQKVNFLRDIKDDIELLGRSYFPNIDFDNFTENQKNEIVQEIKNDFDIALVGIKKLPMNSRLGVYVAYKYYRALLNKLDNKKSEQLLCKRIRIPNAKKIYILNKAYLRHKTNLL